jgi:hypothetical protein
LSDVHKPRMPENWIGPVRNRLAAHRAERPTTKAGQIRALWPEIEAALTGGQSMKSIRQWLEEDAGISLSVASLTSYISRLRRREGSNRHIDAPPMQIKRDQTMPKPLLAPVSARAAVASPVRTNHSPAPSEDPLAPGRSPSPNTPLPARSPDSTRRSFDPLANFHAQEKKRVVWQYPSGPPDESKLI